MCANLRPGAIVLLAAVAALAAGIAWLAIVTSASPVTAHGKELSIAVTPLVPDPDNPLLRLYRVFVIYKDDGDPVEGASVTLSATRSDGSRGFADLPLIEMGHGTYVGEATFPRFGTWDLRLRVEASLSQGEGDVSFSDDIRPGALTPDQQRALEDEAERVIQLQLSFGFGWWPDVVNVAMRIVHSGAGAGYFVLSGLVFSVAWLGSPSGHPGLPRLLRRLFLPGAAASLAIILGAGLYSAAFDAPITSPGVYDLSRMRSIPYGEWYLAAFAGKVTLFAVLAVTAARIHLSLGSWLADSGAAGGSAALASLKRATLLNLCVGALLLANVAILIYLHYVSHLAVFLPET